MAKATNVVRVPKPPADAFNQHRPVSDLLWTQVEYLAAVVKKDIDDERRAIITEAQASAFIKKYTALLHPQGARKKPAGSPKGARKKSARSPKR